jgi:uncharacterized protein (DUF1800 family)
MKACLRTVTALFGLLCLVLASGCGKSTESDLAPGAQEKAVLSASASAGQVSVASAGNLLTPYAAARIADQVSFGATPALTTELSKKGLEAWIADQYAQPVSLIPAPDFVVNFDTQNQMASDKAWNHLNGAYYDLLVSAPDQLRLRVSWALFNFIPVNSKVQTYGVLEHVNLLQRHAFGNYRSFLKELSMHPAMGAFLDNVQNRPTSPECPNCAANENYARELMQLFALGVVKLNPDGTTIRDAKGKPVETYDQEDVEALAKALTGWRFAPSSAPLPSSNWTNAGLLMEPDSWRAAHDWNSKVIMGVNFPAGRDAAKELDAVVDLLMNHPNIAPFVSLRLIQHLVTSDPSPQYISRVSQVFRNNGSGIAGDMKAVIRAVLLDSDARKGDIPGASVSTQFGKIREPVLWYTAALRGLDCKKSLRYPEGGVVQPNQQNALSPSTVFGFYMPTDRAPGSNLLAPEQKLLNTSELSSRFQGGALPLIDSAGVNNDSGCQIDDLAGALERSPKEFVDFLNGRYFRGAMPPLLRTSILDLASGQNTYGSSRRRAMTLMQYALSSPSFGVMK